MSGPQSSTETSTALGCRDNFFDHDGEAYEHDAEDDYVDPLPGPGALILREQWRIDLRIGR